MPTEYVNNNLGENILLIFPREVKYLLYKIFVRIFGNAVREISFVPSTSEMKIILRNNECF